MTKPLSATEKRRWDAWNLMNESVRQSIARETSEATGLSEPDNAVLSALAATSAGKLRQSDIQDSTGWSKSRLSHHLTRMQERGLVKRTDAAGGVEVTLTRAGRSKATSAGPVLAAAVRKHLLGKLTAEQLKAIESAAERPSAP